MNVNPPLYGHLIIEEDQVESSQTFTTINLGTFLGIKEVYNITLKVR